MAWSSGLASGIAEALTLTPAQIVGQLEEREAMVAGRPARSTTRTNGREGSPQEFVALALAAMGGADGVEVNYG